MTSPTEQQNAADFYDFEAALTEDEREVLLRTRAFMREEVRPLVAEQWADGSFPRELIARFRESGLVGLPYEGYGDDRPAAGHLLTGMMAMEMSRVDASVATFFGVHNGLAMHAVHAGGDQAQRDRWLPGMARMDTVGAFALTEPLDGSDIAAGMRTTARREGDGWVLDGAKRWIGNATFADHIVVWARDVDDDQVKGFVVDGDTPGLKVEKIAHKTSLRIVENADLTLEGVRVPESDRLQNASSFRDVAEILRATRSGVAWQALGVMIGAYELALRYACERQQFGRPLAGFQLVQDLLVKSLGNITSSWGMLLQLARLQDAGVFRDEHSSLAKAHVTARMREVVAWAREIFGGNGIVLEYDVARFFADAEAIYSFEGTREMNTLIVGKAITGQSAFV
ncbi:acyl-CoA dehydrogenase family protein [Streptomyces sp. NPDC101213]|uniref:acyl-CoA dehydrogenase family protein n=1 Tax=Streptomyces sp. NPDC101213 TaxID=3366130 RepID=UPI00382E417B